MEEYSYNPTQPLGHTGPVAGSLYLLFYISKISSASIISARFEVLTVLLLNGQVFGDMKLVE